MVELAITMGCYGMLAMILDAAGVEPDRGGRHLPPPRPSRDRSFFATRAPG